MPIEHVAKVLSKLSQFLSGGQVKATGLDVSRAGRPRERELLSLMAAVVAHGILLFPLRHWLVDDAAISMAYAANWSAGSGLVAQPGIPPVEGYSNFLWVIFLALLNLADIMTVPVIKFVSAALVGAALFSLSLTCNLLIPGKRLVRAAVLLLVATNSAIVTWTTSGLENPLTLFLASELLRVVTRASIGTPSARGAVCAGLFVAALAMTRPDGIALAAFAPLALLMSGRGDWRLLTPYLATIGIVFGCFLAFRYGTFGEWVPNTFYAKDASTVSPLASSVNAIVLMQGPFGSAWVVVGLLIAAYLQAHRGHEANLIAPLCLMATAGGVFVLLPPDWMPDRRFATAFIPAIFVFAGTIIGQVSERRLRAAVLAFLIVLGVGVSTFRLLDFYERPTVPTSIIEQDSLKFNERARLLGLKNASVLLPDIGAALMTSDLRVYDLAGLIDPVVARSLHSDKSRFYDYVFDEIRPTFIRNQGPWAEYAAFDSDPRFRRDYLAIEETPDEFVLKTRGLNVMSGEYVRRDVIAGSRDPRSLPRLRSVKGESSTSVKP